MARHFLAHDRELDSAVGIDLPAPNRTEVKRLRGANQVAIIAKATRLVCRKRTRRGFIASQSWRWHARCQVGNRSSYSFPDHCACAERVKILAAAMRASYRGAGTRATDSTRGSRSAAGILHDRSAAGARSGAGDQASWSRDRRADAARISMHLFVAGYLDRMGGRRHVVELCPSQPVRARAVRKLLTERERAVGVHPTAGIHADPAKANDLQRHGVYATRAGGNLGGTIFSAATLAGSGGRDGMLAMRLQLKRWRRG